jgi:uncharacterized protein (DUF2249 family)
MATQRFLDVSDLEPPEPLDAALAAVDTLRTGEYLCMRHRREPFPLYQMLARDGFSHRTVVEGDRAFLILIWHTGDQIAEQAARQF